jgi:hypothetical protein
MSFMMISGLKEKWTVRKNKRTISRFLKIKNKSKRHLIDRAYLVDNLFESEKVRSFIKDQYRAGKLSDRVEALEHSFIKRDFDIEHGDTPYTEDAWNILRMGEGQLLRVYLMLEALQEQGFCNHVGALLEEADLDEFSEHGGIAIFNRLDDNKLILQNVGSALAKQKRKENKRRYQFPADWGEFPRILRYHFHVNGDSGPSSHSCGDIVSCKSSVREDGESHNIVIAKISGNRFNVDYYGGPPVNYIPYANNFSVVDIGNYSYEKD